MIGFLCRDILSNYHACISRMGCAAYVRHYRGNFFLIPFGELEWSEPYPYVVLPLFSTPRSPLPEWTFEKFPYRLPFPKEKSPQQ